MGAVDHASSWALIALGVLAAVLGIVSAALGLASRRRRRIEAWIAAGREAADVAAASVQRAVEADPSLLDRLLLANSTPRRGPVWSEECEVCGAPDGQPCEAGCPIGDDVDPDRVPEPPA